MLELRVRPATLRFSILAVSGNDIHTATTYKGLELAIGKGAHTLYVSDLKDMKIFKTDSPKDFLNWWRDHYVDNTADYIVAHLGGDENEGKCQ